MINIIKNLLFRVLHGFKGYPKTVHGIPLRFDESLRRFNAGGEEIVQSVLKERLKPGDTYVDIGANFGLHTMLSAHYIGSEGKIIAFEPVPENLRLLRRNLKLNGFDAYSEVFECALTAEGRGDMEMTIEPGLSPAASLAENFEGEKILVPTRTLDECLDQDGSVPTLIKIDVEGAEHEVLKGAKNTLKRGPALLIEVHTFALPAFHSSPQQLTKYLAEFGYVEEHLCDMESHLGKYYHALYRVP
jgi:FkbM family methyltransferase